MNQTRLLTIMLAVVLIVAIIYVLGDLNQQIKRQDAYNDQIENQKLVLSNLPVFSADLERQLVVISARTAGVQQAISNNSLNTTSIINFLLKAAESHQLAVSPISAGTWDYTTAGQARYRVLPVEMHIQGDYYGLISFLDQIDNYDNLPNLVIRTLNITSTDQLLSNQVKENASPISAILNLAIIIRNSGSVLGVNQ